MCTKWDLGLFYKYDVSVDGCIHIFKYVQNVRLYRPIFYEPEFHSTPFTRK
jgi:hypothetical protein